MLAIKQWVSINKRGSVSTLIASSSNVTPFNHHVFISMAIPAVSFGSDVQSTWSAIVQYKALRINDLLLRRLFSWHGYNT
jgi:hypothetical protein